MELEDRLDDRHQQLTRRVTGKPINYPLIEVPKEAKIHKLIVEPYENEPVVRYDLREKLKTQ